MKFIFGLLFILTVARAFDDNEDDFAFHSEDIDDDLNIDNLKIAGGAVATVENYKFHVLVKTGGNSSSYCGGVIISSKWVLTAAHCISGVNVLNMTIRAGTALLDTGGVVLNVARTVIHSLYNAATSDYDFGLIEISGSFSFGSTISLAILPPSNYRMPFFYLTTLGWGYTNSVASALSTSLRAVKLPIISTVACSLFYGNRLAITPRMFCAGKLLLGGIGICQGDSGGAAIFNGVVLGIASVGLNCGDGMNPAVFARVSTVTPWIQGITGISVIA